MTRNEPDMLPELKHNALLAVSVSAEELRIEEHGWIFVSGNTNTSHNTTARKITN